MSSELPHESFEEIELPMSAPTPPGLRSVQLVSPQSPRTPRPSRMTLASFAIILIVATVALPIIGSAGEVRSGGSVTIAQNERIAEDLYLSAGTVELLGTVNRDASIAAGDVTIEGAVEGSLNLAAGQADISGTVGGSVRVAAGSIEVTGEIGGDLVVAGGRVTIPSQATIGGDLIVTGGNVDVRGSIAGDVRGSAMSMSIGGEVRGNVDVGTSRFEVLSSARIGGNVIYASASSGSISSGASIAGTVERANQSPWGGSGGWLEHSSGRLLRALWALIAGVVIVAFAPRVANAIARNGRSILAAIGVGLLTLIVAPIIAIALTVSLIGLPTGLILLGLFVMTLYLTQVFAGLTIGRFILPNGWNDGSRGFNLLAMTLGVIVIAATNFIPVPFVSGVISAVVTLWGLGAAAMILGQLGTRPAMPSAG